MNKKVVSLLLAGGMVVSMAGQLPQSIIPSYYVSAEQGETDGFAYQTLADGTLRLTGYTGETSEVTVPSQIGGVSVTVIGEGLFKANRTMTSAAAEKAFFHDFKLLFGKIRLSAPKGFRYTMASL